MSLTAADIDAGLAAAGHALGDGEAAQLADYLNLLLQWNRVHNLTGIRDRRELIDRHLAESLALELHIAGNAVADIGSGGGLPGIPLAVRLPGHHFTLIESRRKRVSFLRHVASRLGLGNVSVAHGRAESLDLPVFDTVLARAVAAPAELVEYAGPLVARPGRMLVLTGEEKSEAIIACATDFDSAVHGMPGAITRSRIVVLERKLS